jgi:hypothetical protein
MARSGSTSFPQIKAALAKVGRLLQPPPGCILKVLMG